MENWPRITIVTPSYNQGEFLEETIKSILDQNYPNLEYFVIDGGSSDHSVAVIQKYAENLDWWVSEPDNGQTSAINKGFAKSTGELLAWVNSDDILLPGCLYQVARYYEERGKPDLIHANGVYIDQDSKVTRAVRVPRQTELFMYRGVWFALAPAVFFRADLMRQVGYLDEQYHLSMDVDIWMKMIKSGGRIMHIPQYLGAFRWHDTSKTTVAIRARRNRMQENPETKRIFDAALPLIPQRRRQFWRRLWKVYQLLNFNYILAFHDTQVMKNKHWQQCSNLLFH